MKSILLTTTALVAFAGAAAAGGHTSITFSGAAGVGLIDDNGASDATRTDMFFESYYDFNIAASAESDNGVSVSIGFDMGAGNLIDYNDDDKLEAQSGTIGEADVTIGYNGWTLAVDQAGIDNLFDDTDGAQDVMLSGAVGDITVALTSDLEGSTSSYKVGGTMAGVSLTLTGTDKDDAGGNAFGIAGSYAMGDLTVKAAMSDESVDGEDDQSVGFSYTMDSLTVGYTSHKPGKAGSFGDEWDASVKYTAGALVASFAVDETDATTLIADFDLGGGASAFAAMHDKAGDANDLTAVGVNFKF
ncbi:MAG: porin [Proteobacteria bacterium]|nr:porin [Pseudomonadota bacterium]